MYHKSSYSYFHEGYTLRYQSHKVSYPGWKFCHFGDPTRQVVDHLNPLFDTQRFKSHSLKVSLEQISQPYYFAIAISIYSEIYRFLRKPFFLILHLHRFRFLSLSEIFGASREPGVFTPQQVKNHHLNNDRLGFVIPIGNGNRDHETSSKRWRLERFIQ